MSPPGARALVLALADDELVLGYRESEWTGVAPLLEEDVALSSIAQDEIGHARALYRLCSRLDGAAGDDDEAAAADAIAYDRAPAAFRHARLCERPRGDWGEEIARRLLYELADAVRTSALVASSLAELAQLMAKVAREERYHLEHARAWLARLAAHGEGRARLEAGLQTLWADALGLWEPVEDEAALVATGVLAEPFAALRTTWIDAVRAELSAHGVAPPADGLPSLGGRRGDHSADFAAQHAEMTCVRRLAPGAPW